MSVRITFGLKERILYQLFFVLFCFFTPRQGLFCFYAKGYPPRPPPQSPIPEQSKVDPFGAMLIPAPAPFIPFIARYRTFLVWCQYVFACIHILPPYVHAAYASTPPAASACPPAIGALYALEVLPIANSP